MFARVKARFTVITSTSSSSTSRMLSARSSICMLPGPVDPPGEIERRPSTELGPDPRPATVRLHDLSHHGESDASALDLVTALERLEQGPDSFVILGRDPDTVVA